jgi:hypothetical protein
MSREDVSPLKAVRTDASRFGRPGCVHALFAASSRASHLGVGLMDSQTRFQSMNAALAREAGVGHDAQMGKTSREIVGDLAKQIEPTYESVLRTGKAGSVWLAGQVRDSVEFGHWFDYCFPIFDSSQRVQQLGLFVVNVTAEKESFTIFDALPTSRFAPGSSSELLLRLDEAIQGYYLGLELSLAELSRSSVELARKVDDFHVKLERLDEEIGLVRELVYTVLAKFRVPSC